MTGLCTTDDYGQVIDACPVWSWVIGQQFRVLVVWLAKVSGSPIEILPLDRHTLVLTILKVKLDSFEERAAEKAGKQIEKEKDKAILKTSETWGAWIDRNYKTDETRKAFIDENYGETYVSADQIVGETAEHFLARSKKGTQGGL